MERRWIRWGFAGEPVDNPDLALDPAGFWRLPPTETVEEVRAEFLTECASSRRIVAAAGLQDQPGPGTAFTPPGPCPALIWILFHLLQEYARHAGPLDVARGLADGTVGR